MESGLVFDKDIAIPFLIAIIGALSYPFIRAFCKRHATETPTGWIIAICLLGIGGSYFRHALVAKKNQNIQAGSPNSVAARAAPQADRNDATAQASRPVMQFNSPFLNIEVRINSNNYSGENPAAGAVTAAASSSQGGIATSLAAHSPRGRDPRETGWDNYYDRRPFDWDYRAGGATANR